MTACRSLIVLTLYSGFPRHLSPRLFTRTKHEVTPRCVTDFTLRQHPTAAPPQRRDATRSSRSCAHRRLDIEPFLGHHTTAQTMFPLRMAFLLLSLARQRLRSLAVAEYGDGLSPSYDGLGRYYLRYLSLRRHLGPLDIVPVCDAGISNALRRPLTRFSPRLLGTSRSHL
jgi:hypothetical protein